MAPKASAETSSASTSSSEKQQQMAVNLESGGTNTDNDTKQEKQQQRQQQHNEVPLVQLDLENVTYAPMAKTTKGEGSRITVLSNITTSIAPYQLTAWMGPSGSGKTSLISVAANLTGPGDITNESTIYTNGEEGTLPKRLVGVVWQDDLLLSNLTVEETIYFSARLKTSPEISDEQVQQLVQQTIEELGLDHVKHSLIGNSSQGQRGISGGERKRVAVAAELVVRPSLLLLDEPTSGLDATTAWSLMSTLRQLAHQGGHAIAVVIHQPRTEIFSQFDHLLLLNHGRTVYNGPPKQVRTYLETIPSVKALPPETGIADWLMDIIKDDDIQSSNNTSGVGDEQQPSSSSLLANHWCQTHPQQSSTATSPNQKQLQQQPPSIRRHMSSLHELEKSPKFVTPFAKQLRLLTHRTLKQMRGERLTRTAIYLTLAYTFFSALFWWRMPNNTAWIYQRNSLLFFMLIAQSNGIVTSSISVFQRERALLKRERAKKLYGVLPFFLSKTLSDMTINVLYPCLYGIVVYWACGFRPGIEYFAKYVVIYYLTMSTAQSMGLFLSVLIPSMQIAMMLAPPITLFFMIMGGFYIPFENMHPGVRWLSWLSFARHGYSSMLVNEFSGRDIPCAAEEGESVAISIGADSGQCPLPGEEVLSSLGIDGISTNYWSGVWIILLLQIAFRVMSYVVLRRDN